MELRIDGVPCDIGSARITVPGYSAKKMADIDAAREGRSLRLTIPPTRHNDVVMTDAATPHAGKKFNETLHHAELLDEDALVMEGSVRLLSASEEGYTLEIRDGGPRWATNASRRMLSALGVDYQARLLPETIRKSWTDSSPVKFFPVCRDEYPAQSNSTDLLPAERLLTVDDYHPFLHVATMIQTIFAEAGYRLESRFAESELFHSLYMSGAYASHDTAAAEARMGFFARRLAPVTATASSAGWVYADPLAKANTVGNIVETATPQTSDTDGEPIPELFNNGSTFGMENGQIRFVPTTRVSVGFEYTLKYTTDHRILSRTRLKGFDSIYLGPGSEMRFTLANRYEDRRQAILPNHTYRIIVFDHAADDSYRLTYTRGNKTDVIWTTFEARTAQVTTAAGMPVADPVLWVLRNGVWKRYTGDWVLYDGHIGETGQTTVELRVRTAAEIISPTSPKYFHTIHFFGAEAGMKLTLDKRCSLRPCFLSAPGYGATLTFNDVARHRIRQSELLKAVAHLFNLRFLTDETTATVRMEPADDLCGSGPEADWRTRTDFAHPVALTDIAPEIHETRSWCYQPGDGAVTRFDTENDTQLGTWTTQTTSCAAKEGEEVIRNPLFLPTLSTAGHYNNAPSARLLQVGDRDVLNDDGTNFSPRIVRYMGLHPLPEGERWGYPSNEASYPLAAFHFAGDQTTKPFTLCFEDRDGAQGLHRYYDRQVARESESESIGIHLCITPHEFAALPIADTKSPELRSVFRIDTGRGTIRATIREIGNYDPSKGSVECLFDRLLEG